MYTVVSPPGPLCTLQLIVEQAPLAGRGPGPPGGSAAPLCSWGGRLATYCVLVCGFCIGFNTPPRRWPGCDLCGGMQCARLSARCRVQCAPLSARNPHEIMHRFSLLPPFSLLFVVLRFFLSCSFLFYFSFFFRFSFFLFFWHGLFFFKFYSCYL